MRSRLKRNIRVTRKLVSACVAHIQPTLYRVTSVVVPVPRLVRMRPHRDTVYGVVLEPSILRKDSEEETEARDAERIVCLSKRMPSCLLIIDLVV